MNLLISGGTGFIGQALVDYFVKKGDTLYILTRGESKREGRCEYIHWLSEDREEVRYLADKQIDAVINLAGESILKGRWSSDKKERILNSRIQTTKRMIDIVENMVHKPSVFIQGSAIGYYGYSNEVTFTDRSLSLLNSFPSEVCDVWENTLHYLNDPSVRKVIARIGIVLHPSGGALPQMMLPNKFFIGGKIASGEQVVSWIHMKDLIRMIEFMIEDENIHGPINMTAPNPVTMEELGRSLSQQMKRPYWFNVQEWMLHLAYGEKSASFVEGGNVLPEKMLDHQFTFEYPTVKKALSNLIQ